MKLTFKNIIDGIFVLIFVGIFIISFFFRSCSTEPPPQTTNKDSLYTIIAEKEQLIDYNTTYNKQLNVIIDSLKHLKPKFIEGKDRIKDSLIFVSDSVCINNLTILYNECQKVDSVNNQIITNQETHIMNDSQIIGNMADIIALKQYQHVQDSLEKIALLEKLPLEFKRGKKQGRRQGILIGKAGEVAKDALYLYLKK